MARVERGLPGPDRSPLTIDRANAPAILAGIRRGVRPIPVKFHLDPAYANQSQATAEWFLLQFLGAIDVESTAARTLVAVAETDPAGNPASGTTVQVQAIVGPWSWDAGLAKILTITFYAVSGLWQSAATTWQPGPGGNTPFRANASPFSMALSNAGQASVNPLIAVCMGTQRTASTATVGWTYRKTFAITNNTTEDWHAVLATLDFGDHAALVTAGKAQASGNDLRVRIEGREYPVSLTNPNTKRCFVHFPLTLAAGSSVTAELVYGNPSATAPQGMTTYSVVDGTYCAIDLGGDAGTASAGAATTLTDSSKAWSTNRWTGAYVQITAGTGSGQRRRIASSTGTVLTVDRAWGTTPDATSVYAVWHSGVWVNGGVASAGSSTTLTDASQAFATNELINANLWNVTQGTGPFSIQSNTATVITINGSMTAPAVNDVYYLEGAGAHHYNVYAVDNDARQRGCWQANRHYSTPTDLDLDGSHSIGGWGRTTYLINQDDYAQSAYQDRGPIGVHAKWIIGGLSAWRRRQSARLYNESKMGDGVSIADPRRYRGLRFDYYFQNDNSAAGAAVGIGQFVAASRETAAQAWETFLTNTTKQAWTLGSVAYYDLTTLVAGSALPTQLYLGTIPQDGANIAQSAGANDQAGSQTGTQLELYLDPTAITYGAASAEAAIYDLNGTISSALGVGTVRDDIEFGGPGHYIHLATNEVLFVDCAQGLIYVQTGGPIDTNTGYTFAKYAPWAAVPLRYEDDPNNSGTLQGKVSANWLPLPIGASTWYYQEAALGSGVVQVIFSFNLGFLT